LTLSVFVAYSPPASSPPPPNHVAAAPNVHPMQSFSIENASTLCHSMLGGQDLEEIRSVSEVMDTYQTEEVRTGSEKGECEGRSPESDREDEERMELPAQPRLPLPTTTSASPGL
jgi:hypothetical protein